MTKITFDGPGKYAVIILENPKDIGAMVDIIAQADKTKFNKLSNAYKLARLIDDELPVC